MFKYSLDKSIPRKDRDSMSEYGLGQVIYIAADGNFKLLNQYLANRFHCSQGI